MGIKTSIQEIFNVILKNDAELAMAVQWYTSLVGKYCWDSTRKLNIDKFGNKSTSFLESNEDKADEETLLDDSNIDVYPESKAEESHN